MTVIANARKVATVKAAPLFKGKGATLQSTALAGIASAAYAEGKSRADVIVTLVATLGKKPTDAQLDAAKVEYIVGRTAVRLPDGLGTVADRIAYARDLIANYAYPAQDGVKPRALKKGQKGRRTPEQHKLIRAGESAWSLVKADAGYSDAAPMKAKTAAAAKKRGTNAPGTKAQAAPGITHSELVKPDGAAMTKADAVEYIGGMAKTLAMYCKKHAKVTPAALGTLVNAFQRDVLKELALIESTKDA